MKKVWVLLAVLFAALLFIESNRAQGVGEIVKMNAGLDAIVPATSKIEKVADGFSFIEGPVWDHRGYLLFSDIPQNVINKWTPDGKVSVFLKESGLKGKVPHPVTGTLTLETLLQSLVGSNGLTIDKQGRVIICEHGNRQVERLEADGRRTVVADRYEGKRLSSPNDVTVKSDGSIYFTDPPFGLPKGDDDPAKETPFNGVYRVSNGKVQVVTKDLKGPNGLVFSPDEKYLYVDDSIAKIYMRYEVKPDGLVENGKVFYDASKAEGDGVPDGMKVDRQGNIYACGPGGIRIFSPDGTLLGMLKVPQGASNLAWGDDGKTLYMTAWTNLFRIRLNIPGVRP